METENEFIYTWKSGVEGRGGEGNRGRYLPHLGPNLL